MTVSITSVEKNAVFDIIAPNQKMIKQEATNWSAKLPTNGEYRIVVGGTRGNATYKLRVEIK
jgi:small-conductance mechanosensitive channel